MTHRRREVWPAAIIAAGQASWRVTLVVLGVVVVPGAAICTVGVVAFGPAVLGPMVVALSLFVLSSFIHELGHAVAHVLFADPARAIVAGRGAWASGSVVRWSLGTNADGAVAIAGPFAAMASGLLILVLPIPFILAYPVVALFSVHLLSLTRHAADGSQVRRAIEGDPDA